MSILKFTKGRTGASGKHVDYIMRDSACRDVSFYNLDELNADELHETKINARSYAYAREDVERARAEKGITHYRMVLSFDRQEDTDRAREQAHKFLQENFRDSRAIVAIHQDTQHTHAHVWFDSRQTDERKIHLNPKQYKSLDERFAKQYDREYGTNYAPEYKAKKQQTKEFQKEFSRERRQGKQPRPENKSPRSKDRMNSKFFREKEAKDKGVERNDESRVGGNQRTFEVRDRQSERADRAVIGSEQQLESGKSKTTESANEFNRAIESSHRAESAFRETRERLNEIRREHSLEKSQEKDRDYGRDF